MKWMVCPVSEDKNTGLTNKGQTTSKRQKQDLNLLCDPMDYIFHGILQARILEWVAFPFSREISQPKGRTQVACIAGRFFTS